MPYMDTKFCEICDEDYDWARPECPGCQSRKFWEDFEAKFIAAKSVIYALPKCDRPDCKIPATRYQIFNERDSGTEFQTSVWRCEKHKLTNGKEIDELGYAPQLRKWLELNEK